MITSRKVRNFIKAHIPTNLLLVLQYLRRIPINFSIALKVSYKSLPRRLCLLKFRVSRNDKIAGYFSKVPIRKIQLGAGSNYLQGWLNSEAFTSSSFTHSLEIASDYIFLNVCEPFPFEDGSIDYIFHEHVIEHLDYHHGQFMLKECFRILKPGGRMRTATPDLQFFIELYGNQVGAEQLRFLREYIRFNSSIWSSDLKHVINNDAVFVLNHAFRAWGHQFLYDEAALAEALHTAGFVKVERQLPQESQDEHLCNLELRRDIVGVMDALILEAQKPKLSL